MVKKHSLNQSLVAHTGSATGFNHSLDAPVVCTVSSNVHDNVGQIKYRSSVRGSEPKSFQDVECWSFAFVHHLSADKMTIESYWCMPPVRVGVARMPAERADRRPVHDLDR
eukprot:5928854-Pleurochrysis_carterae.AAC.5